MIRFRSAPRLARNPRLTVLGVRILAQTPVPFVPDAPSSPMLFPISDDNRAHQKRGRAWGTLALVLLNLAVFFVLQQGGDNAFTYGYSVVPLELTTGQDLVGSEVVNVTDNVTGEQQRVEIPQEPGPWPIYLTVLSAMFMHGGFGHLFGNLLYLWIFGDNVEHRFGHGTFLAVYLACGIVATLAQVALDPASVVPNLGASGAISGVLGAYLVLFPRNRVRVVVFFVVVSVPALVVLGLWIATQLLNGWGATMASEETVGGVAYMAHIGGFLTGVLVALLLRRRLPDPLAVPPPLAVYGAR